jgi:hypothetical protein
LLIKVPVLKTKQSKLVGAIRPAAPPNPGN